MIEKMQILSNNQMVDGKYKIQFFLKKGSYAESYRVLNLAKETKFLKLFDLAKLHRSQFTKEGDVLEIEILKELDHPNLVKHNDNGMLILNNQKYAYVVLDFISGETLADKIAREEMLNPYEAKDIILGVLNGLSYLHNQGIIHNELTNLNVMLDLSGKVPIPKIIDFGYARYLVQSNKDFLKDGLYPFYQANEAFNGIFSPRSDFFTVGALYYHLLEGIPPYFTEISKFRANQTDIEETILAERAKPLYFSKITDENTKNIVLKALQPSAENRFADAKEFISALNGELKVQLSQPGLEGRKLKPKEKKVGKGFNAIAGLDELKSEMQRSVIDVLQNPEKSARYGAKIPNGMVLYGPPGCGKTFFAKHFAEEVDFNFVIVTPSSLKSRYVNATQENIAKMFEEAEKNAPTIIFIDEINELLPNRDSDAHEMSKSAVNEMLAQMDRTGEKGVFVIGATNYPDTIDPAMLRSGRLEKLFFLPPPDAKLRKTLFKMSLNQRREVLDFGIDYEKLSILTENYVSADIEAIVNESSSLAMADDARITMDLLEEVIKSFKPFPKEELEKYLSIKAKMDGENKINNRPRIGFKT